MNDRQSERKSPDSLSLSIRVALYLNRESETACNPLISSWASTCFKLTGAQGRSSFIAADTPNPSERHSSQCQRTSNALKHQSSIFFKQLYMYSWNSVYSSLRTHSISVNTDKSQWFSLCMHHCCHCAGPSIFQNIMYHLSTRLYLKLKYLIWILNNSAFIK
jgi:hypothetical protein